MDYIKKKHAEMLLPRNNNTVMDLYYYRYEYMEHE